MSLFADDVSEICKKKKNIIVFISFFIEIFFYNDNYVNKT